jgi:serine/threonine-protein kinase OSR1/STK39
MANSSSFSFAVNEYGWPLAPEGYEIKAEVGRGAFAQVLKAFCPSQNTFVALKVIALENITTSLDEIQAEVLTMRHSRHPNVLELLCCFVVKTYLWIVTPLMDQSSCHDILRALRHAHRDKGDFGDPGAQASTVPTTQTAQHFFSEEFVAFVLRETLQGLEYVHSQHAIHRDIKAGNILVNSDGRVVLADFGVAGWMSETGPGTSSETSIETSAGSPHLSLHTSTRRKMHTLVGTP